MKGGVTGQGGAEGWDWDMSERDPVIYPSIEGGEDKRRGRERGRGRAGECAGEKSSTPETSKGTR